ncbi:MAG: DNA/RNA nuclease SfsA [Christensenellales bacterium]|jgi:sugar fermentation stimulation protein A
MKFDALEPARLIQRLNRFAAAIQWRGGEARAHVPNSGRMAELLVPGAELMVAPAPEGRATACTLELVRYGDQWVCVHAVRANRLAQEALEQGLIEPGASEIRREVAMGGSRVDLAYRMGGQACFLEVKSVTLIRSGWACFPDAPTTRGVKHLRELAAQVAQGNRAGVLFVIGRQEAQAFEPNYATDPDFARALCWARAQGVWVAAHKSRVSPEGMDLCQAVPLHLEAGDFR